MHAASAAGSSQMPVAGVLGRSVCPVLRNRNVGKGNQLLLGVTRLPVLVARHPEQEQCESRQQCPAYEPQQNPIHPPSHAGKANVRIVPDCHIPQIDSHQRKTMHKLDAHQATSHAKFKQPAATGTRPDTFRPASVGEAPRQLSRGSRPIPGSLTAGLRRSKPVTSPRTFSSSPSTGPAITPSRPNNDICMPVPEGGVVTNWESGT